MQTICGCFTTYSLPEDAKDAEAAFLSVLNNENETHLEMYGDTLPELYAAVKAADASGIVIHVMLDHTQASGPTEKPLVADLVNTLKNGTVTITSAGPDAEVSGQIAHRKRIFDVAGNVVFGSVNASWAGYYSQTNDMVAFKDLQYVTDAIAKFNVRQQWALETHPDWQIHKTE